MTKAQKINMYEKIGKHGTELIKLFGGDNPPETDPIKLCKTLRRIETRLSTLHLTHCNHGVSLKQLDQAGDKAIKQISGLLPGLPIEAIHINRDPRGYALKICDKFMREEGIFNIYSDWGGYGILAPDFTPESYLAY